MSLFGIVPVHHVQTFSEPPPKPTRRAARCSKCGSTLHNVATCANVIRDDDGVWKTDNRPLWQRALETRGTGYSK